MVSAPRQTGAFGAVLRRYRVAAGLSQEQLAEQAGLSRRGIADLERGVRRAPYPETIARLTRALKLGEAERAELTSAARPAEIVTTVESATVGWQARLPISSTSFVGREREVEELRNHLQSGRMRLLTLTGTGGSGKTRLALEAVAGVEAFPQGVSFVPLAPVIGASLLVPTVAHELGVREVPGRPIDQLLIGHLRDRRLLLVLDNLEHLLPLAGQVVADLLKACPDLTVLVTSRAVLQVSGEHVYSVRPLTRPSLNPATPVDELLQSDAVRLFVERARAVQPRLEWTPEVVRATAQLCARVDGLPLAIELAAARVRLLNPRVLLGGLGSRLELLTGGAWDLPARQRALRATIGWSHDLLPATERLWFQRLGVFIGGFTIEAAQAVCDPDHVLDLDALAAVVTLHDQSLVTAMDEAGEEPRFGLLETVREFAVEQARAHGRCGCNPRPARRVLRTSD